MSIRRTIALVGVLIAVSFGLNAQKVGVKTNLLTDATLSPNLGVELGVAKHWTVELDYQINAWTPFHNKKGDISWKHWMVMPEGRWWYCEKFQGSFVAMHLLGGQFNVGNIHNHMNFLGQKLEDLTNYRFQGWYAGVGVGYGYAWSLAKHWNLEFEVALGYAYMWYDRYEACVPCDDNPLLHQHHNYFGLTKVALSLEYLF